MTHDELVTRLRQISELAARSSPDQTMGIVNLLLNALMQYHMEKAGVTE